MITYKKCTDEPRLRISYDISPESPRYDSTLGVLVLDRNSIDPDDRPDISRIVYDTNYKAEDFEDHVKLITHEIDEQLGETVVEIFQVCKCEHGIVKFSLGSCSGWDCGNSAMYIVLESTLKELGLEDISVEQMGYNITGELDAFTQWVNGEIYSFILYNKDGDIVDSMGGFYDTHDMKEYLPDEWQHEDLDEYLITE